jgi:diguanylate cyclase (GGDEF)-like protein
MAKGGEFFDGLDEASRVAADAQKAGVAGQGWALLREVTELMSSPIDRFDEVVESVLETIMRLTGADRGFIMLFDDAEGGPDAELSRGALRVRCERNVHLDDLPEEARRVSRSIVDEVVRTEEGVAIADLGEVDRFGDAASVQELRLLSVMCVPLLVTVREGGAGHAGDERRGEAAGQARRVIGVIYVDSRSVTTSFGDSDLVLFQALANVATTAILHADTFRRATTDRLTGLLTRRRARTLLAGEVRVARKAGASLGVLLADVDGLRQVNAERGYAAGDAVLVQVADVIRQKTRTHDLSARWGAEEFLVVLPATDLDGAGEVARKVLLAAQAGGVKLSIGVAAWKSPDEGVEALVRRADQALSLAKAEGGGRARPWKEALAQTEPRADKLAGVFGGDAGAVYRNVLMLLESMPAIHREGSVDRVLGRVVESVVDLARAERGFLFLRDGAGRPVARVGRDRRGAAAEPEGVSTMQVERVLRSGEPAASEGGGQSAQSMCAPLSVRGGAALGAVYVEAEPGAAFAPGALAFLTEFAHQAAVAVDNARLLDENRDKTRKIEKLMHALEEERSHSQRRLETTAQLVDDTSVVADNRRALETRYCYDNIVGQSATMRRVFRMLDKVTASMVPVFIHGESGTGKELVAKAVHFNGPRRARPFIAENCGAVTETLLESELFGYVKGAFTGANTDKKGLFELADGGTILLDEVGEMTPTMQTKLLRVLQEGEIRRVGGKDTIKVDVRIVSASNRDIKQMVDEGTFREDLFYRLNVVRLDLPPLRDRRGDVPLLVDHMLAQSAGGGQARQQMSPEALDILSRHTWPGNVRELANVIERARILADGPVIGADAILLDSAGPGLQAMLPLGGPVGALAGRLAAPGASPPPPPPSPAAVAPGSPLASVYFELNERQRRLIEYLQVYGSIRNRDYYEIMGVSKSTGWRDLKDLMERELVQVKGRGKGSVYSLVPELQEALGGGR